MRDNDAELIDILRVVYSSQALALDDIPAFWAEEQRKMRHLVLKALNLLGYTGYGEVDA